MVDFGEYDKLIKINNIYSGFNGNISFFIN